MSVTISRLRHHGAPGLQAQKYDSTENNSASTMVIGTTLAMVCPNISTISSGKLDMAASPETNDFRVTRPCLRRREPQRGTTIKGPAILHFMRGLKAKFTVLKNNGVRRYLHSRINCVAILRS